MYNMVEVSLTVGKLDASLALLLTKDHHLIEFPTILLPNGVRAGSIVKIRCDRDLETERTENAQFRAIQDEILATFGKNLPQNPRLHIKNVTQTSCVLEWDPLDLGTASLKNLVLFKDGKKLGTIPQPLSNRTTKLSGLPIDKSFKFQLRLDTTAGVFSSDIIDVHTHKMTDLSGITVCLGDITANEHFTVDDIQETLKNMGAHYPAQETLKVDTTHYITMRENKQNPEYLKANEMNIPIVRPEWLKACERERRIVGVRDFYVKDCALPDIYSKNYWQKSPVPAKVVESLKEETTTEEAPALPQKETVPKTEASETEKAESEQTEQEQPEIKVIETEQPGTEQSEAEVKTEVQADPEVKNEAAAQETLPESSPLVEESIQSQSGKDVPQIPEVRIEHVLEHPTADFSEVDLAHESEVPVQEEGIQAPADLDLGAVAETESDVLENAGVVMESPLTDEKLEEQTKQVTAEVEQEANVDVDQNQEVVKVEAEAEGEKAKAAEDAENAEDADKDEKEKDEAKGEDVEAAE